MHETNLTNYEAIVQETLNISEHLLDSGGKTALYLDAQEIIHLMSIIRVHHRQARSINILGTALKYVAGTPDADDFSFIKSIQDRLADNNERQFQINSEFQNKINNITDMINKLVEVNKNSLSDNINFLELVLHRNRIVIAELNNVMYSISLAKLNIVNPALLNTNEINSVIFKENFDNVSVSDVLNVATVKAIQSENVLYFLVKYPKIKNVCNKISVFPVVRDEIIVNLETDTVAKCGHRIQPLQNCQKSAFSFFCEILYNATCIESLFSNLTATCKTLTAHHIPSIQILNEGVIILNNKFAEVREDSGPFVTVNGTFAIFFDDSVTVNGLIYFNHKKNSFMSPEAPMSQRVNFSDHISLLSLPYLDHVSSRNLNHINQLKQEFLTHSFLTYALLVAISIFCIFSSLFCFFIRKRDQKIRQQQLSNALELLNTAGDSRA